MPRPLNTDWYSPAKLSLTSFRVVISIILILAMRSSVSILWDFHVLQYALHYLFRIDILSLGLECGDDAMPQNVRSQLLYVVRNDIPTAFYERIGPGG